MAENGHPNGYNGITNGNGNGELGELTGLQRAFVDAWFECRYNGVEAARRAGYQGTYSTLGNIASRNLKMSKVQAAIAERWGAHGLTGEEAIARLAGILRFNPAVLFKPEGGIDWDKVREHGEYVKRIEWERGSKLKVECYDAQRAAEFIAKILLAERVKGEGLTVVLDI